MRSTLMRRHKPHSVEKYIKIRLKMLYDERDKNDDDVAHMVLDKSIFELHEILSMIERTSAWVFQKHMTIVLDVTQLLLD